MKKVLTLVVLFSFLTLCSSHRGRVCGGAGGQRCVEKEMQKESALSAKRNS
jgi:hypothetical protein